VIVLDKIIIMKTLVTNVIYILESRKGLMVETTWLYELHNHVITNGIMTLKNHTCNH